MVTSLPGIIQAEDFDDGASGISYYDATPGNTGGYYRSTDVDIEACTDTGGGFSLGYVGAGEWLAYTVNVAASGTYDIDVRVASERAGGTFHIEINGVNVTGLLTVPSTGAWQSWTSIRKTGVTLNAGQQLLRLVMDSNGVTGAVGNFNYIRVAAPVTGGGPYGGTAVSLPGLVQLENFDEGAQGVAYSDNTPQNLGGQYRATAVDIEPTSDTGGGFNLGWVGAGEWLKYSVNVTTAGAYDLEFRVASEGTGGTFHLEVNGADVTGPLTAPKTGTWQTWTTLRKTGVALSAGPQAWRVVMDANGATGAIANFNYLRAVVASGGSAYGGTPVSLPGTIQAENFDEGGAGVAYVDTTATNYGGQYRSTGVDIESTTDAGGGYDVGWALSREWLNYSVNVATAGTYDLDVRVASAGTGGRFHVEVDGVDKTGPLVVPNTGGWQIWTTLRKPGVAFTAGPQTVRLVFDADGATGGVGNFNWVRVSTPTGQAILRGPYLQQVTDTSAIVVWTTRDLGTGQVRYAAAGGTTSSVTAIARLFPASDTGLAADFYQYEARLTGLSAATRYTYDVFMGGVDATPGQDTLTTAPGVGSGSVRFIAFGDSGVGSASQSQLAARMAADTFDLALHTGDVAYGTSTGVGGPSYTQYDNWLFGVYGQWMRSRPFYPSIGNHDDEINHASAYRDVFVLPDQGASTAYPDNAERYYSFDYGPVHFVALDTEYALLDAGRKQAQLAWLDADLAATSQPWRIVYFHRSPYSSGAEHGSMLDVRQAFSPILERRGVQLVLSSHDHDYERSVPWREFVANGNSITYVVTGGGGAPLYSVGTSAWTAKSASVNEYVRVAVASCTLTIEGVGLDGAVFDQASINRCTAANNPPLVAITAPQDGSTATVGSNMNLVANASDTDGTVSRVDFRAGSTMVGSATSQPFSVTWTPGNAGTYSVTAVATDDSGATTTSSAVSITVDPPSNQPPSVSLTSPSTGSSYTAPATVALSATASDPENSLARVEFYAGTTRLNTDASAPFGYSWSGVAAGTYTLQAIAYDTAGASATSSTVTITVRQPNQAPTVALTTPATGATYTAPATISL